MRLDPNADLHAPGTEILFTADDQLCYQRLAPLAWGWLSLLHGERFGFALGESPVLGEERCPVLTMPKPGVSTRVAAG